MLSSEDIAFYKSQGYLVLKEFVSGDECSAMREQAASLVDAFDPSSDPRSVFNANSLGNKHTSLDYFIESTNKISFFFESSSFDSDGRMLTEKSKSIVKIGHALHDYDPVFQRYSHSDKMCEIARALGYKRPLIGQSRYFYKMPGIKGVISPHQDSTVLYTEPLSCYAVWLALEDATIENGCLWVAPGSHLNGLRLRVLQVPGTGESRLTSLGSFAPLEESAFIPLEVKAGTAIVFKGELIHKSNQNMSETSRQAYALHFIEGAATHVYPQENWLQRPGGFGELRAVSAQYASQENA